MRRPLLLMLASCAGALVVAAPARASYVTYSGAEDRVFVGSTAGASADAGLEVDGDSTEVRVTRTGGGTDLAPGPGCVGGPSRVLCVRTRSAAGLRVVVTLDDQADARLRQVVTLPGSYGTSELTGSAGPDELRGGSGRDVVQAGAGDDVLVGGPSPADGQGDQLFGGAGSDRLDGGDGPDLLQGGAGGDDLVDTGTSGVDVASYLSVPGFDDFRTAGVDVSLDGVANDGSVADDDLRSDLVGAGIEGVSGTELADRLVGSDGDDRLLGYGGPDVLAGGHGVDELSGAAGQDRLEARDGTRDRLVDCNNSDASRGSAPNVAVIDGGLDEAVDCSEVDAGPTTVPTTPTTTPTAPTTPTDPTTTTGPPATTTPAGTTGTTPAPPATTTSATTTAVVAPRLPLVGGAGGDVLPVPGAPAYVPLGTYREVAFALPDFRRPTRQCSGGWCRAQDVKDRLERAGLNVELTVVPATAATLRGVRPDDAVRPGEVLATSPAPGTRLTSGPTRAASVRLQVFEPADLRRCDLEKPVRLDGRTLTFPALVRGRTEQEANALLADANCPDDRIERVYRADRRLATPTVTAAVVRRRDGERKLALRVDHPPLELGLKYASRRVATGEVPPVFLPSGELVLPAVDQRVDFDVLPSTPGGVGFERQLVQLLDARRGVEVERGTTRGGAARIRGDVPAGPLDLWTSVCDHEGDCMAGLKRIRGVALDRDEVYLGFDLNYWAYDEVRKRWVRGGELTPGQATKGRPTLRAAVRQVGAGAPDPVAEEMGRLAQAIVGGVFTNREFVQGLRDDPGGAAGLDLVGLLNGAANRSIGKGAAVYMAELRAAGFEPFTVAGGGGTPARLGLGTPFTGQVLVSDGATLAAGTRPMLAVGDGVLGLRRGPVVLLPGGRFYVVRGGGYAAGAQRTPITVDVTLPKLDVVDAGPTAMVGLAGPGPAGVVGQGSGTLVAAGGLNAVAAAPSGLVGQDGASLIGQDGASLIGQDGGSLVGQDGGSFIAP